MNAVQAVHQHIDDTCTDEIVAATVKGLIVGYDARWRHTMGLMAIEAMEQTYIGPLINPANNAKSRTWRVAGKVDKLIREPDGLVLYDHKTTSQDIEDPNAVYWRTLQIDSQHQHYELLLWLNGLKVDRIVWDVVRKPGIRPKKLAKKERTFAVDRGEYCGQRISRETQSYLAENERENAELFGIRVAAEVAENPNRYFARRSVVRTNQELLEYAEELWMTADSMRAARRENRHYRNPASCMNYGRPCVFLGVCSGHDGIDSDNWQTKEHRHAELGTEGDAPGLLTNSRLRSFLACRRKHFYEYELAKERIDTEDAEALTFGRCWHAAADLYWSLTCRNGDLHHGHHVSATAGSEPAIAGHVGTAGLSR